MYVHAHLYVMCIPCVGVLQKKKKERVVEVEMDRLVYVYKSRRKLRTFLYVPEKDVFSHIPSGLMDAFGAPEFVMVFALHKERKLQKITPEELTKALDEKGYLLRIDLESEEENMLNQERARRGLPPLEKEQISDYFH